MAPEPVILNRRLNDEYPLGGPPASEGGFPYARADCHCCDATTAGDVVVVGRVAVWSPAAC